VKYTTCINVNCQSADLHRRDIYHQSLCLNVVQPSELQSIVAKTRNVIEASILSANTLSDKSTLWKHSSKWQVARAETKCPTTAVHSTLHFHECNSFVFEPKILATSAPTRGCIKRSTRCGLCCTNDRG